MIQFNFFPFFKLSIKIVFLLYINKFICINFHLISDISGFDMMSEYKFRKKKKNSSSSAKDGEKEINHDAC